MSLERLGWERPEEGLAERIGERMPGRKRE